MISQEVKGEILIIKGEGQRYTFMDVIQGTIKLLEIAEASPLHKILIDYTSVSFHLPLSESFNLIRYYEKNASWMKSRKLAIILHLDNYLMAETWATIGVKSGFRIKHFKDNQSALDWLST